MKEGEHYQVHFSRGALRRRKSVSDARTPSRSRHCVRDATPGFETIVAVDEVDHRRRSQDMDVLTAFTLALPPPVRGRTMNRKRSLSDARSPCLMPFIPGARSSSKKFILPLSHRPSRRRTSSGRLPAAPPSPAPSPLRLISVPCTRLPSRPHPPQY